jgi:hypothetical protein
VRVVIFSIKYRTPKLLIFIGKDDFDYGFWLTATPPLVRAPAPVSGTAAGHRTRLAATRSEAGRANARKLLMCLHEILDKRKSEMLSATVQTSAQMVIYDNNG